MFSEKPTLIFETRTRIFSGVLSCLETRLRNLIDFLHFRDRSDNVENENWLISPGLLKEKYFSSFLSPDSLQLIGPNRVGSRISHDKVTTTLPITES